MKPLAAGIASVLLLALAMGQSPEQEVVKRVSPDAYKGAPAAVRSALKARHCELPATQNWDNTKPVNIVSGHFASPDQTDWAALCILPDNSLRALIFWGGKAAACPAEIHHGWALEAKAPAGEAGDWYLVRQGPKIILAYRKFFSDENTNPVTHDGIEVGDDQASLIYYCYKGQWLELQGND